MEWMREYVRALKRQAGVRGSDEVALLRMLEALPGVEVEWSEIGPPRCEHYPGGRAVVILPPRPILPLRQAVHEAGHAALTTGGGWYLLQVAAESRSLTRLAWLWIWRDERTARAFEQAFFEEE